MIIKRGTKYRKHLATYIPDHFVCPVCGGNLIQKLLPGSSEVVCAADIKHTPRTRENLPTRAEWEASHPLEKGRNKVSLADTITDPDVVGLVREIGSKTLYGEGE